jgi:D-xylulose reductase
MAKSLVLERKGVLALRDIDVPDQMTAESLRVQIRNVGICGSDVHFYTHGRIGPFVVEKPLVLGHEASGTVIEVGSAVKNFKVGDRVCMEPGVPTLSSRAAKLGIYNVDTSVTFWACPPVHGCLTGAVVHPAAFTYKLPDDVSYAEGAMIEPLAVAVQACAKARLQPADVCLVTGCGPIGILVALAAIASGASKVFISDMTAPKLEAASSFEGLIPVNIQKESIERVVRAHCGEDWGVDVAFDASGHPSAYGSLLACVRPGGQIVLVGMPVEKVEFDVVGAQAKEIEIKTVFRYCNVYDRAIALLASGKIDVKPLITATFPFSESVQAFERAASGRPSDIKLQIKMPA